MNLFDSDDLIRVGIVGTRRRDEGEAYFAIREALMRIYVPDKTVIVSGGCRWGGDRFAEMIAAELGMPRDLRWSDQRRNSLEDPTILPDMEGQRIVIHYPHHAAFEHIAARWRSTNANYARDVLIARDSRDYLIASVAPDRKGGTEHTIKHFEKIHKKKATVV